MKLTQKVLGLSLAAIVGFSGAVRADDAPMKSSKRSLESRIQELEAKLKDAGVGGGVKGSGIKISGYVDTSYTVNLADRDNTGPVAGANALNTGRVFDNQYNSFNLNAVKLTIEKDKDSSKFPAGFRVDTIYGEDARIINGGTGAFNNNAGVAVGGTANDSQLAVEQAYITLGVPVGNGIDIKFGKMVTLLGYEVVESPANWQFSRSDAFRLSPVTQTGITMGYQWNDWLTSTVGIVNGLDSAVAGINTASTVFGAGNQNTDLSFVGRLDFKAPKTAVGDFNAFVAAIYGNDIPGASSGFTTSAAGVNAALGAASSTENGGEEYIWNIGGNWDKPFGVKPLGLGLDYLYRNDTANVAAATAGGPTPYGKLDANALSGYGKWDWNKWLTTSARMSYSWYGNIIQRNAAGLIVQEQSLAALAIPGNVVGSTTTGSLSPTTELFSFTLTQAFNVWKDTLIRLEWRHDWTDSGAAGFGTPSVTAAARNDIRTEQDTVAVNVVYSF